jgi:serine/threonine protein phosphatase PrpC
MRFEVNPQDFKIEVRGKDYCDVRDSPTKWMIRGMDDFKGPKITATRMVGFTKYQEYGLSHEAEIQEFDRKPEDKYFYVGTDGLWDAIDI